MNPQKLKKVIYWTLGLSETRSAHLFLIQKIPSSIIISLLLPEGWWAKYVTIVIILLGIVGIPYMYGQVKEKSGGNERIDGERKRRNVLEDSYYITICYNLLLIPKYIYDMTVGSGQLLSSSTILLGLCQLNVLMRIR